MESWNKAKKITTQLKHKKLISNKMNAAHCKKHPKHIQSPGVCSVCLNEKLSQLSNTSTSSKVAKAKSPKSSCYSSDLSSLSSSNASSYSSPVLKYTRRLDSKAEKSMRLFSHGLLKKSRSMAFVLQRRKEENGKSGVDGIKRGFWSKLLQGKNKGSLMHSRTTRERVINYH